MKKILILIVILLLSLQIVIAEEGIYDFVDSIVKTNNAGNYAIVVGDFAPAADVLTTNDLVTSFNNLMQGSLGYKLVSEISTSNNLILLGNPCDNSKVDEIIKCESWPYEDGEALIMLEGSNLIIAGTTPDDTNMAAHAIINYEKNLDLKTNKIMVKGTKNNYDFYPIKELKEVVEEEEKELDNLFVCGDGICEPGEEETCPEDCFDEINICEDECIMQGFLAGVCRQVTDECNDNEVDIGGGFCEEELHCCCEEKISEDVKKLKEEKSSNILSRFFKAIGNWFTNLF